MTFIIIDDHTPCTAQSLGVNEKQNPKQKFELLFVSQTNFPTIAEVQPFFLPRESDKDARVLTKWANSCAHCGAANLHRFFRRTRDFCVTSPQLNLESKHCSASHSPSHSHVHTPMGGLGFHLHRNKLDRVLHWKPKGPAVPI